MKTIPAGNKQLKIVRTTFIAQIFSVKVITTAQQAHFQEIIMIVRNVQMAYARMIFVVEKIVLTGQALMNVLWDPKCIPAEDICTTIRPKIQMKNAASLHAIRLFQAVALMD